jgi:predicted permease
VLRNPVVMSVVVGVATGVVAVPLPAFVDGLAKLSSGAAVPCALFALGATLARLPIAERLLETSWMVLLKLVIYPAVVGLVLFLLPGADPSWRAVALLAAAMPMGANVYLAAERYETCVARASTAVLLSTAASVVTVSALAVVLAGVALPPMP